MHQRLSTLASHTIPDLFSKRQTKVTGGDGDTYVTTCAKSLLIVFGLVRLLRRDRDSPAEEGRKDFVNQTR